MGIKKIGVGISLAPDTIDKIDAFALERGQSRSQAARTCIEVGLQSIEHIGGAHINTVLAKIDYTQAGVDFLLSRDAPEEADRIADMVTARYGDGRG